MLVSSEAVDLKYKNGVASLRIGEIFPEDEGEYVCTATNSQGSKETACKLTVKCKNLKVFLWLPSDLSKYWLKTRNIRVKFLFVISF